MSRVGLAEKAAMVDSALIRTLASNEGAAIIGVVSNC